MSEINSDSGSEGAVESAEGEASEGVETSEGQGIEAKASPEQKQAMAILKEKFKLVVDGEEFEEELDWNNKEDIKRRLQKAHAADKRMSEAKAAKAKAFDIVKAFEADPESILERLGAKGREVAEKFLLKKIQDEMMTPEEKERREKDARLKKYEDKELSEKTEAEKKAQAAVEAKYAQEFQATIISALEKTGLPKTPALVKRMASIMDKNLRLGLELTADDLVIEVKNESMDMIKSLVKDADGDHLISLFGEDIANKIRKSDLKKLQEKQGQVFQTKQSTSPAPAKSRESKPMTIAEWKEQLNNRIK